MTDIAGLLRQFDPETFGQVQAWEAADEIGRLRLQCFQWEITVNQKDAEIKRLRKALLAAKDYIGNGYQPPELIKQIDSALKQSE